MEAAGRAPDGDFELAKALQQALDEDAGQALDGELELAKALQQACEAEDAAQAPDGDFELAKALQQACEAEDAAQAPVGDFEFAKALQHCEEAENLGAVLAKKRSFARDVRVELSIMSRGTRSHPCFLVRDPFNDRGKTVMTYFQQFCEGNDIPLPKPRNDDRWMSWKDSRADKFKNFKMLDTMANRILDLLRKTYPDTKHLQSKDRGYSSKDINVYSQGGGTGPHQDAQEFGRLVLVFCAGNTCRSSVWLGGSPVPNTYRNSTRDELRKKGYPEIKIEMTSGDVMVFEGKTWHQVHECLPNTGPTTMVGTWLENRRLSILVRKI